MSGQNVGIVAGVLLGLVWLLGRPRALGHVAANRAICGYVLAVGWKAEIGTDDESVDEPEVAVYCCGCWDREFVRGDGVPHS